MTNNWNSPVMEEFEKIAKEQGFLSSKLKDDKDVVGNAKEPTPVKDHRRYEPTEEYDVTDHKCIVEQAHPEKMKELAESNGNGGVVENIIEQQEVDIEAATNMPSGALVGVHANLIHSLVKIANDLEDQGNYKAAAKIDEVIVRLNRPFQGSRLHKEAFWGAALGLLASFVVPAAAQWIIGKVTKPETSGGESYDRSKTVEKGQGESKIKTTNVDKGVTPKVTKTKGIGKAGLIASAITAGVSVLGMIGNKITSIKEGLKVDTKDLLIALNGSKSPTAISAAKKLQPFSALIDSLNLAEEQNFKKFTEEFIKFNDKVLPSIEQDIIKLTEIEDVSVTPYGLSERIKAKLDDVKSDVKDMAAIIKKAQSVGSVLNEKAKEDMQLQISNEEPTDQSPETLSPGVKGLQEILSTKGFLNKKWNVQTNGELDNDTINAAKELEQMIDQFIKQRKLNIGSDAKQTLIKNNTLNPELNPENLYRLLTLLEQNK